jgi:hypothetical protein
MEQTDSRKRSETFIELCNRHKLSCEHVEKTFAYWMSIRATKMMVELRLALRDAKQRERAKRKELEAKP